MQISAKALEKTSAAMQETVRSLLRNKGTDVWSVTTDATVYEAIALMAEKGIGAVLVLENGKLAGIMSERDYARKVFLRGRSSKETAVREIMSSPVFTVTPQHTVADCMALVTDRRIRHLPVVDADSILGVVSIGDVVNALIHAQADTIEQLSNYISGKYPG